MYNEIKIPCLLYSWGGVGTGAKSTNWTDGIIKESDIWSDNRKLFLSKAE